MNKNKFSNRSISLKITLVFTLIMFLCVGSILIFNTFFLEQIYINERADVLKNTYNVLNNAVMGAYKKGLTLDEMFASKEPHKDNAIIAPGANPYRNNSSILSNFLVDLQDTYNVQVVIIDADSNVYSMMKGPRGLDRQLNNYIFNGIETTGPNAKLIYKTDNYQIVINGIRSNKPRLGTSGMLECWGNFDDKQTFFLLSTPIISIKEPIRIFNNIVFTVSIIIMIIGLIVIYITSRTIANPIKKLAKLSNKMSKLDFSEKYEGKRQDEIGILGESMNAMSEKLEKSISDLQHANKQLQKDLEEKEKLDVMRQEFVANVSHELKTPIALIQGYAEGLTEGLCEEKESRDYYCNVIMDEATKMNKIVRQLLSLSSIEKGNEVLDIVEINLENLVRSVVNSCSILLKEKNINCVIDINENIIVLADELKSEEVLRNYITNAINHVDDNKLIKIYTSPCNDNSSMISLCVYNSGKTLSDENLNMIWEKFYKVDKAHTRAYGGTGLGLPIVKAIASQHNTKCGCYNITCSSNDENSLKEGIVFYFNFKLKS